MSSNPATIAAQREEEAERRARTAQEEMMGVKQVTIDDVSKYAVGQQVIDLGPDNVTGTVTEIKATNNSQPPTGTGTISVTPIQAESETKEDDITQTQTQTTKKTSAICPDTRDKLSISGKLNCNSVMDNKDIASATDLWPTIVTGKLANAMEYSYDPADRAKLQKNKKMISINSSYKANMMAESLKKKLDTLRSTASDDVPDIEFKENEGMDYFYDLDNTPSLSVPPQLDNMIGEYANIMVCANYIINTMVADENAKESESSPIDTPTGGAKRSDITAMSRKLIDEAYREIKTITSDNIIIENLKKLLSQEDLAFPEDITRENLVEKLTATLDTADQTKQEDIFKQNEGILNWAETVKYKYSLTNDSIYKNLDTLHHMCLEFNKNYLIKISDSTELTRLISTFVGKEPSNPETNIEQTNIYVSLEGHQIMVWYYGKLTETDADINVLKPSVVGYESLETSIEFEKELDSVFTLIQKLVDSIKTTNIYIFSDIFDNFTTANIVLPDSEDKFPDFFSDDKKKLLTKFINIKKRDPSAEKVKCYIINTTNPFNDSIIPDWKKQLYVSNFNESVKFSVADDKNWSIYPPERENSFGALPKNICNSVTSESNKPQLLSLYLDSILKKQDIDMQIKNIEIVFNYYYINYVAKLWCMTDHSHNINSLLSNFSDTENEYKQKIELAKPFEIIPAPTPAASTPPPSPSPSPSPTPSPPPSPPPSPLPSPTPAPAAAPAPAPAPAAAPAPVPVVPETISWSGRGKD